MESSLLFFLTLVGVGTIWLMKKLTKKHVHVVVEGDMLVTGEGEVVIEDALPQDKKFLHKPEKYVTVEFEDASSPPCAGGSEPDTLSWELVDECECECDDFDCECEVFLKISWHVNTARTIKWVVKAPR